LIETISTQIEPELIRNIMFEIIVLVTFFSVDIKSIGISLLNLRIVSKVQEHPFSTIGSNLGRPLNIILIFCVVVQTSIIISRESERILQEETRKCSISSNCLIFLE